MPSFKNFEKNLEGATRGQSFTWEVYGIFGSNLPPLVFDTLTFILYCIFFTAVASGRYLYKSTIFSNKRCFWLPKIAKNIKTIQREYNHCMDCCKHGPAVSRLIKITFQSEPINNSLCPSMIIVPELVMHDIELICTCDHLNTKVH